MNRILVIGSLNMDLAINAPRRPEIGETLMGNGFMTSPGGKGANQAVAAARLGGEVCMIGCVGKDAHGCILTDNLKKNRIDISRIAQVEETPTGVAVITIVDGDNYIVLDSGANALITPQDIIEAEDLIKSSDIVVMQLEIPMETVMVAAKIAKRSGTMVLLDPAPASILSDELLSMVDIITPNQKECSLITGIETNTFDGVSRAIEFLISKGIKQVIVTMGGDGVVYNSGNRIMQRTVPKVKVVDTTAAGDSFSGALAVALSNGKSVDDAISFANIVATITVTRKGAQTSLPMIDEVENFNINSYS